MMARVKPGVSQYPCVERGRWYPVIRRDPHVDGYFLPVPGDGFEGERFVFAEHFETKTEE